nr:nucleotidyltransferase family protein [Virgibacillus sp. AGTR]
MMDKYLNLSRLPNEVKLLLDLINENNEQAIFAAIDWDKCIDLMKHHRIYPLLYSRLKVNKAISLPSDVIQFLSKEYRRNTMEMLHLSAEIDEVSNVFAKQAIPLIVLKGPVLAHELYGDISLRTSSDIDVLIPLDRLKTAEALLKRFGYEKDDYIQTILNDWKWRHHHVTYIHPQKQIKLELHWRLHPGPAKEPSFTQLWDRRRKSSLHKSPVYLLGYEDLFLFLVSHGARHGWSRLRWIIDIQQMLKLQKMDWMSLNKHLKKYGYHHIGGQSITLARDLVNTTLPKEWKTLCTERSRALAQDALFYLERKVNLHASPVPEEVSRYHKWHLFSLMAPKQKLVFILSFLYPYPEDGETLPLPKKLHVLYFPLRPFLWLWRKTVRYAIRGSTR